MRLISSAKLGDKQAFDHLVERYDHQLKLIISRKMGIGNCDDILQDVWLAAWEGIAKFHTGKRFKPWLYGIAIHKCMDHSRKLIRIDENEDPSDDFASHGRIDPALAGIEMRLVVREGLSKLPSEEREILEMYYYLQLTLPEIAKLIQKNISTVKYHFYKAHTHISHELQQNGIFIEEMNEEKNNAQ